MEIKNLRLLVAIGDSGTLAGAASRLGVSRQAASKMLQRVEAQAGFPVFERKAGRLVATPAGGDMLGDARRLLDEYDKFCERHFRPLGVRAPREKSISIAMVNGGSDGLPPHFIARFVKASPSTRLALEEANTDSVLEAVRQRKAGVGIVGSHPELLGEFETCCIQRMGVWLLAPQGHPFLQRESVRAADLDGVSLVTAGARNHLHKFVLDRCYDAGVSPEILANAADGATILRLTVSLGALCFGFSPDVVAPPQGLTPVRLDVEGACDFGTYAIRVGGEHSDAEERFWRYAQAYEGGR